MFAPQVAWTPHWGKPTRGSSPGGGGVFPEPRCFRHSSSSATPSNLSFPAMPLFSAPSASPAATPLFPESRRTRPCPQPWAPIQARCARRRFVCQGHRRRSPRARTPPAIANAPRRRATRCPRLCPWNARRCRPLHPGWSRAPAPTSSQRGFPGPRRCEARRDESYRGTPSRGVD